MSGKSGESHQASPTATSPGKSKAAASPFDAIRRTDERGEFWLARELAKVLGYSRWANFQPVLPKVEAAITNSKQSVKYHMLHVQYMIAVGKGAQREVEDVRLTKYACFLTAQNADPNKEIVALAQTYFAVQTQKQEIAELRAEQEKRVALRERVSDVNKKLSEAAQDAGVPSTRFGIFHDAGYKGLYDGLGVEEIKHKKEIPPKDDLLDRMGREELAANEFRITQTEAKLRRETIRGEQAATDAHHAMGRDVREFIIRQGNTLPEDLPPEPTIKPLMDERTRKRKQSAPRPEQASLFDTPEAE